MEFKSTNQPTNQILYFQLWKNSWVEKDTIQIQNKVLYRISYIPNSFSVQEEKCDSNYFFLQKKKKIIKYSFHLINMPIEVKKEDGTI